MPTDERVLVISTEHFRSVGYFHGFRPSDEAYLAALLDQSQFSFRPRFEVETDAAFKQLIPYVVLQHGDHFFHYRRGKAGTEKRLESLRSIGIGGHISEVDAAGAGDPYRVGMARELSEEVDSASAQVERLVGFINDDRTLVGSVHLGVVHLFELNRREVQAKEAALANGGFGSLAQLSAERASFETWSQFVLDWLVTSSPPGPGRSSE